MVEKDTGKRELILEAAIKIFVKKGFQQSKIEEIAQEAEVGKGTVYEYFVSKKELFMEMVQYTVEHYAERIKGQLKETSESKEKLKLVVLGHLDFCHNNREMAQVFFQDHSWVGPEFTKWLLKVWREKVYDVQEILQAGIDRGDFGEMDTYLVATAFLGMLDGICTPLMFTDMEVNAEETAEKIVALILKGVEQ